MPDHPSKLKTTGIAALLFAANAFVCHKLFFIEYLNQMASIEGSFIAISRYAMENYRDMTWWPLWFCGMPYQNVYGPVLHHLVAAVAMAARISPALAFHAAVAILYCLGPVTLFWMAYKLSDSLAVGWWAGLLYSVISPAAILIPVVRADTGGAFFLRRLHNLIVWGEQPHVAVLTLAPVALLALDAALRTRRPLNYALSAAALACLALTNVTGSVGFAMILLAYFLAGPPGAWRAALICTALIGMLAYGLAAPWIPPSTLRLISANSERSAGNYYPLTLGHVIYLCLVAAIASLLAWLFAKWRLARFLRISLFLTLVSGAIVLPAYVTKSFVLPQPERFQLEFEMGCCAAAAYAIAKLGRAPAIVPSLACVAGLIYNHQHADVLIQPIEIRSTTEYKEAVWFDQNMGGRRVFAPGSVSFWMNIFTDTPQLGGCCDQGVPHWQERVALYVIYSGQNAGASDAEVSLLWLQAYGVHAISVSGPGSGEWYKPFANPRKFDGMLPVLWRDGGDVVYQVPQLSASLAHVIQEGQVIRRAPKHGLDIEPLRPYVTALDDPQIPIAAMKWTSRARATISADMRSGDLLSAQVAYHPGWHALVNGAERRIESDAIGMMVVHPECAGACVVDLVYDGGLEMKIARGVQFLSLAVCSILALVRRSRA